MDLQLRLFSLLFALGYLTPQFSIGPHGQSQLLLDASHILASLFVLSFEFESPLFYEADHRYIVLYLLSHGGKRLQGLVALDAQTFDLSLHLHELPGLLAAVDLCIVHFHGQTCLLRFLFLDVAQKPIEFAGQMIKKPGNIDRVCAIVVMCVSVSIGIDRLLQFLNRIDIVSLDCFPLEALLLLELLLKSMRFKLTVILRLTWCTATSYRVVHLIHHHYVIRALVVEIENGGERCLEVPAAASALLIPVPSLVLLPLVLILCRLARRCIATFLLVSPSKVQVLPAQVVVVIAVAIYTFIIGVSY